MVLALSPGYFHSQAIAELDPVNGKWEEQVPNREEELSGDDLDLPSRGQDPLLQEWAALA